MSNITFTEFQDLVKSFPLSEARAGIIPPGRYRGFDSLVPNSSGISGGFYNLMFSHYPSGVEILMDDDEDTLSGLTGVIVSPHGTILHFDQEIDIPVPQNVRSYPVYYIVYCEYHRVNTPGGATPSFGITNGALTSTQIAIGSIQVNPSTNEWADVVYNPNKVPDFGYANIIDNHPILAATFAMLSGNNNFSGVNTFNNRTILKGLFSQGIMGTPLILGRDNTLTLHNGGNIFTIDTNGGRNNTLQIINLVDNNNIAITDGTIIFLKEIIGQPFKIRDTLTDAVITNNNNIIIPAYQLSRNGVGFSWPIPDNIPLPIVNGVSNYDYIIYPDMGMVILMKQGNNWIFLGTTSAGDWAFTLVQALNDTVSSFITTKIWTDITDLPNYTVVGPEPPQYYLDGLKNVHLRGNFSLLAGCDGNTLYNLKTNPLPVSCRPTVKVSTTISMYIPSGVPDLLIPCLLVIGTDGTIKFKTKDANTIPAHCIVYLGETIYSTN